MDSQIQRLRGGKQQRRFALHQSTSDRDTRNQVHNSLEDTPAALPPLYDYEIGATHRLNLSSAQGDPSTLEPARVPKIPRDFNLDETLEAEERAALERERQRPTVRWVPTVLAAGLICAVAVGVAVFWHLRQSEASTGGTAIATIGAASDSKDPSSKLLPDNVTHSGGAAEPRSNLVVYVTGAVHRPGVVGVKPGGRINDAIIAAGGTTPDAMSNGVNLASPVKDGQQVHVPRPGDTPSTVLGGQAPSNPDHFASKPEGQTGKQTGPEQVTNSGESPSESSLNLNTATAIELESLPGVGPKLAQAIVEWRVQNGNFSTVEELDEVSGIGPAMLKKLTPHVVIQ